MKCKKCGAELNSDFKFCRKCGTPVDAGDQADTVSNQNESDHLPEPEHLPESAESKTPAQTKVPEIPASTETLNENSDSNFESEKETGKKPKFSKWILIGLAVLLLAAGIGGGSMLVNANKTSDYQETISMANRYYNRQDYEMAEEYYLQAIEILPKQKEPYTQLVHIYTKTEQPEEAEAILTRAKENLNSEDVQEVEQEVKEARLALEQQQMLEEEAAAKQSEKLDSSSLNSTDAAVYRFTLERLLEGDLSKIFTPEFLMSNRTLEQIANREDVKLQHSLFDVNGDGTTELLVQYVDDTGSQLVGFIFTHYFLSDGVSSLFYGENGFSVMSNGFLQVPVSPFTIVASKNFAPFDIYRFNPDTTNFESLVTIEEFDRQFLEENYIIRDGSNRLEFPEEYDLDNDGKVYRVITRSSAAVEQYMDKQEMEDFINERTNHAELIDLVFVDTTTETISQLQGE